MADTAEVERVNKGEVIVIGTYSIMVEDEEENSLRNKGSAIRITFAIEENDDPRSAVFFIHYDGLEAKESIAKTIFGEIDEVRKRAESLSIIRNGIVFFITCLRQEGLDRVHVEYVVDDDINRHMSNLPFLWERIAAA